MENSIEETLNRATEHEERYEWLEAAKLIEKALKKVDEENYLRRGQIQEKMSRCFERSAFQALSREQFRERMEWAREACEKACIFYENSIKEQEVPLVYRCEAIAKYIDHWIRSDPSEKRKLLDECLELEEKALDALLNQGNKLEYARAYNELPLVFRHRAYLEGDSKSLREILEKGISWGEKAVEAASELGDSYEAARAELILVLCMGWFRYFYEDLGCGIEKSINHARKAVELSEQVGDAYLIGLSYLAFSYWAGRFGESSIGYLEKALQYGEETRDNYLIASILDYMAYHYYWKAIGTEDPDQKKDVS